MHKTILLFAVAFLTACASTSPSNVRSDHRGISSGRGLIVGSATQSETDSEFTIGRFLYEREDGRIDGGVGTRRVRHDLIQPRDRTVDGDLGDLFAIELPPGRYRVVGFNVSGERSLLRPAESLPPLTFDVIAGEAVYLGNLDLQIREVAGPTGVVIAGATPSVRDRYGRDSALLRERYPFLNGRFIEKSVVDDAAWAKEYALR